MAAELIESSDDQLNSELIALAPRPRNLQESGLSARLLEQLILKQLSTSVDMNLQQLSEQLALPGNIIEERLQTLKQDAQVEIHADGSFTQQIRFALTRKGYHQAQMLLSRDGYIGPAPVPLSKYQHLTLRQTTQLEFISRERLRETFAQMVISEPLLMQFGPALNSGRAIFSYGQAGTGKTYFCRQLMKLFKSEILIPYSVCIGEQVIQLFDPLIHKVIPKRSGQSLHLSEGHDQRLLLCKRPQVLVGGELTSAMLEIQYDADRRLHYAPLQMKANNGLFIIDDLGRQQASVSAILNRWILPLEERIDFLSLHDGTHFDIPFEMILVFSTNLKPTDLADDAFLRRIGYKIQFHPLDEFAYRRLWQQECHRYKVACNEQLITFVIQKLHKVHQVPMLASHPRDLISLSRHQLEFMQHPLELTEAVLSSIWHSYFIEKQEESLAG